MTRELTATIEGEPTVTVQAVKDGQGITRTLIRWAALAMLAELAGRASNVALGIHETAERAETAAAAARARVLGVPR
jgi:hypothetical protein